MISECLNRVLNQYDLVLCMTYYSNLKDCEYGIYIDNRHVFTKSDLVVLKTVYKITNLDLEQEQIKKDLYIKYMNSSNNKISIEDLKIGHIYCTFTNRKVYLYLGNWKLDVETTLNINISKVYDEKHHLFVCIDMAGSDKEFVTRIINRGYCSLQDIMDKCYVINNNKNELLENLLICDKPKFTRDIGSIMINGLEKDSSFMKSFYGYYMTSYTIKYTFKD